MSAFPDSLPVKRQDLRTVITRITGLLPRRFRAGTVVIAVLALVLAGWSSERWARVSARAATDADARQLALSNALLFDSELQKFRLLPAVLSEYPDAADLLKTPTGDPAPLNQRLEILAQRTGAAVIYVIAPSGRTLAASNFLLPTSFVGQNYAFRPYFADAMTTGTSELFAQGTVSGRPGLYIARRVGPAVAPLGVIVVKIEFDTLQYAWRAQRGISFIVDRHGVVIVSSRPDWLFHRLRALRPEEVAEIARSRQFSGLALPPLPVKFSGRDARLGKREFRRTVVPVTLAGAQLVVSEPIDASLSAARARVQLLLLVIATVLGAAALWHVRHRERLALQRTAQRELEGKVQERTAALSEANAKLVREGAKRQRSEERYRRSREELAQANRLATLGQVAAGVAHEINQPVAAIRTFSENAQAFLARSQPDKAQSSLAQVVALTERIAQITGELRTFARRRTPSIGPTPLDHAIEGALLLVHHRVMASSTQVVWEPDAAAHQVIADRVRLEQVFVNLVQNALDATGDQSEPRIVITPTIAGANIFVDFADNGTGVPEAVRRKLFTPFATGREEGLGLGLAIARDILREFGGDLELIQTDARGSVFRATLVAS
jgi:two-component system C4-dicarboxylate transport sensor histidine kinase DctB